MVQFYFHSARPLNEWRTAAKLSALYRFNQELIQMVTNKLLSVGLCPGSGRQSHSGRQDLARFVVSHIVPVSVDGDYDQPVDGDNAGTLCKSNARSAANGT